MGDISMLAPVPALVVTVLEGVDRSMLVYVAIFVVVDSETLCSIITLTITQM